MHWGRIFVFDPNANCYLLITSMKRKADEIDLTADSDDEDLRLKSSGLSQSTAP